jgi:hypothetical protein
MGHHMTVYPSHELSSSICVHSFCMLFSVPFITWSSQCSYLHHHFTFQDGIILLSICNVCQYQLFLYHFYFQILLMSWFWILFLCLFVYTS